MILNTIVAKLAENDNRVILDPHNRRHVLVIDAVALVTVLERPMVLLYSKELGEPLEVGKEIYPDPDSRENRPLPVVSRTEDVLCYMRRGPTEWKNPDELFSILLSQQTTEFKVLEFSPAEQVYPIYGDNAEEAFDQVDTFIDTTGFQQPARMMLRLRWVGRESRNSWNESPTKLKYGNVMIWSATSGNIFWVTRGNDGVVRALEIAGCAADYTELLAWIHRYHIDQWVVRTVIAMPYCIRKAEPREEAKPVDPSADINLALQQLLDKQTANFEQSTIVLLNAVRKRFFQPVEQVDLSEEYEQLAGDTILEYSAGKSAVVIKALNEVKLLIQAAFVKKSNEER
jgi:hypothetical protein